MSVSLIHTLVSTVAISVYIRTAIINLTPPCLSMINGILKHGASFRLSPAHTTKRSSVVTLPPKRNCAGSARVLHQRALRLIRLQCGRIIF